MVAKNKTDWNRLAEKYTNQYHAITDWCLGYSIVKDLLRNIKDKKILDYGCGSGKFARVLRDSGAFVKAVDISPEAIKEARKNDSTNISYKIVSSGDLASIKQNSLDGAIANFVLCCISDKNEIMKILNSINERLKSGGALIICEPHPKALGYKYISFIREKPSKLKSGTPIKVHLKGMDKEFYDYWRPKQEYIDLLKKSGFEIMSIEEPIIKGDSKETFWCDEKVQAPFLIIKAMKGGKIK